ncbi:MAG: helix-turn-helix transcriptional regulator [Pseudomonadota bacterium]
MAIIVRLDVMLALRKMKSKELAARIGISEQNLSMLRQGKVKGVRFATIDKICEVLECTPGDLLDWEPNDPSAQIEEPD